MTNQVFSTTNIQIDLMVQEIQQGTIRLPDFSDPLLGSEPVRDLFDSLYQGYPAGYFLFGTNSSVDSHGIGSSTETQGQNRMIVDGQQFNFSFCSNDRHKSTERKKPRSSDQARI